MRPEATRVLTADGIIVAFDTSAAHCAAALMFGGKVITRVEVMAKGQAERLVPMLEEVLAEAGVIWADVSAIVVGTGPGNFTGIRISVALARGLALGLRIPAVGVSGFEALAHDIDRPVVIALDAPRGQAYVQGFTPNGAGPAEIAEIAPPGARRMSDLALPQFIVALAMAGQRKLATEQPRPAPFYLRDADAAPPADPPPVILS